MRLYYKKYNENAVEIPEEAIIMSENDLQTVKGSGAYPIAYCWEAWIINKISENAEGYFDFSKNLIDLGACLGEYCWLLPFKHSYAFEPNKTSLYRLHMNLVLHDRVDDVDTFQDLLSDKNETVRFDGYCTNIGGHICYKNNSYTEVEAKTLDSFEINNVGLIKIDVEGMEEKVLRGGIGTIIRSNYPPILFELWDVGYSGMTQEKHDSLVRFLESLGYEILWYWGDGETHLAIHKN